MANSVITATMQITNTGGLDNYLSVPPKQMMAELESGAPSYASMFSYNYRKITPFAKHSVFVPFNEKVDFGKTITATVPFLGDLLHTVNLYFKLPQLAFPPAGSTYLGWTNAIGYAMIESVQVRIGETVIDEHNGLCMEVMDYLTTSADKAVARYKSVGRYDNPNVLQMNALSEQDLYIPLQFWFTKKLYSSLPMISLTGQSLKFQIKLRPFISLVTYDGTMLPNPIPIQDSGIILDFFMLSDPERMLIKEHEQNYLIEQWQYLVFEITAGTSTSRYPLEFTKCVKEIVFFLTETESEENNDYFNFGNRDPAKQGGELLYRIGLAMDGKTREDKLPESYYRQVNPQRYHTFAGSRNIYIISFSENPEINQPTGTANFSRYDNVELLLDFIDALPQCRLHVLGIAYNRLNFKPDEGVQIEFLT